MKKIFALAIVVLLVSTSLSFAAAEKAPAATAEGQTIYGAPSGTADANDTLIGKLSNGVYAGWKLPTGTDAGDGYSIITQHTSGSKSFGSSHDSTAIYRNDTVQTAIPGDWDVDAFGSGWTAM